MGRKSSDVYKYIEIFKHEATKKLSNYLFVFAVICFPLSISRMLITGWHSIYTIHLLCFVLLFSLFILREKLSYGTTIQCYVGVSSIVVGLEFFQYGLAGGGALAAVFSLILSLLYLNRKSTIIVATVTTGLFLVGMYRFVYLKNPMSFPDEPYGESLVAWVIVFMACVLFFFLIGISTSFLQQRIIDLSSELDARNKAIEEQSKQIEYYANHDLLTGLPSLRVADKRLDSVLQSAEEKRHKSALLFLDLDGFKMINDRYGHDAGDTVLKTVSVRILSVIRSTDTACRIGGDEFLVIIERVEDSKDIASLCSRLINTISMPVSYKNIQLTVGVSIGAATYPCSAEDANSLRAKADELMYQVKHSGKNNYQIAVENTSAAIH